LYRFGAPGPRRKRFKWADTDFLVAPALVRLDSNTFEWRTGVLPHEKTGRPTRLSGHWRDRERPVRRPASSRHCYHVAPHRPRAARRGASL